MSGNEGWNGKVSGDVKLTTFSGIEFQVEEAAAGKARLPTVESLRSIYHDVCGRYVRGYVTTIKRKLVIRLT